jgi:hypothetical protein
MTYELDQQGNPALVPDTLTVDAGDCVQFSNQSLATVTVTVSSYQRRVPPFTETSPGNSYVAEPAGSTQHVSASSTIGSADGSIVIRGTVPTPSASPTGTPTHTASPSSSPSPTASQLTSSTPSATSSTNAPTPAATATSSPTRSASPTESDAPFLSGLGTPPPTSSPAPPVVAGPLQPPSSRQFGLPAALAALFVVATGSGLVRVLLAEPL